jgi:hypothetical protein
MSAPDPGSLPASLAAARLSEPAWVRNGSAEVQREYALGVEFERMLVQQLTSQLAQSAEPHGEESGAEEGDAASSVLSSMIPGALADGVVAGGGLGLAADITRELQGRLGTGRDKPAGEGTAKPTAAPPAAANGGVEADLSGGTRA